MYFVYLCSEYRIDVQYFVYCFYTNDDSNGNLPILQIIRFFVLSLVYIDNMESQHIWMCCMYSKLFYHISIRLQIKIVKSYIYSSVLFASSRIKVLHVKCSLQSKFMQYQTYIKRSCKCIAIELIDMCQKDNFVSENKNKMYADGCVLCK